MEITLLVTLRRCNFVWHPFQMFSVMALPWEASRTAERRNERTDEWRRQCRLLI